MFISELTHKKQTNKKPNDNKPKEGVGGREAITMLGDMIRKISSYLDTPLDRFHWSQVNCRFFLACLNEHYTFGIPVKIPKDNEMSVSTKSCQEFVKQIGAKGYVEADGQEQLIRLLANFNRKQK